jgi:hypothetical protein
MDDEHELPPDDLDALIDDLQKGSCVIVPISQQHDIDFLRDLVNSAQATELDPAYSTRLYVRLKKYVALLFPRGAMQIWWASLRPWHPWRRCALALTSIMLISILAISSIVSTHMHAVSLTPVLASNALDGLAPNHILPSTAHEITLLSATRADIAANTTALLAVQAPEPPHTPLPTRTAPGDVSINH